MSADHMEEMNRVHTNASVVIPNELFEKIYLNPRVPVKGELRKTFANPTPMGLMGFLIATTSVACTLMEWNGSGGGGAALVGAIYVFGGVLQSLASIMEWILGNTFSSTVFAFFGAFTFTLAITLTPSANAEGAYTASATNAAEIATGVSEFKASFGVYLP
ncbi:hypothetical protein ZTR_04945 [Talaromyces verruculosus]|nr:hypothetical protein ZTR_04945 [Talaromyces verruculosus]